MSNKKQTLTVVGRRNKQNILKDFVRPSPANVVSGPDINVRDGERGDCAPGTGQPGSGIGVIGREEDIDCAYVWSASGHYMNYVTDELILPPEADWYIDAATAGISNGQLSNRIIDLPELIGAGDMHSVLFGAYFYNSDSIDLHAESDCIPSDAERNSTIFAILTIDGDYFSDPYVDYPSFGIANSRGYHTTLYTDFLSTGTIRRLKYYASGRHVFGALAHDLPGGFDLISGWVFDQWVVEEVDTDLNTAVHHPTGVVGPVIPLVHTVRRNPDTLVREETIQIGDYKRVTEASFDNDFSLRYERSIGWSLGSVPSEHPEHYAAAYKGAYSPITVDLQAAHRFYIDPLDYKALPSNTRKVFPMERDTALTWVYPWQDILDVYNVWIEGLLIPKTSWSWNPEDKILTLTYEVSPESSVLADAMVQ